MQHLLCVLPRLKTVSYNRLFFVTSHIPSKQPSYSWLDKRCNMAFKHVGESTGRRQGITLTPVCDDGGGETVRGEVNVDGGSLGGMGEGTREMDECGETLKRATSGPLFSSSSTCLAASSSLPGNRTPLKASARGNSKGRRGGLYGCVCYITKKVFYCPHTQILPGTSFFLLWPNKQNPIHKIAAFNVIYKPLQRTVQ